jgi:hypothetical protein
MHRLTLKRHAYTAAMATRHILLLGLGKVVEAERREVDGARVNHFLSRGNHRRVLWCME